MNDVECGEPVLHGVDLVGGLAKEEAQVHAGVVVVLDEEEARGARGENCGGSVHGACSRFSLEVSVMPAALQLGHRSSGSLNAGVSMGAPHGTHFQGKISSFGERRWRCGHARSRPPSRVESSGELHRFASESVSASAPSS